MTITDNFLKTYTDKTYQHTTMLRHNGTVVSLAMDQQRRIYYSVLNLDDDKPDSPLDVNYWLENPQELRFPNEISQVGYAIANSTLMPIIKKGSRDEAERGILRGEEIDPFLSSTARLTANAQFQALSDEKYIYIFRQSINENHKDMVFQLNKLPPEASGDEARPNDDYIHDLDGDKVPLVKDTLLVDRFILAGTELKPKMEVRYQRSRSKTNPQNSKDSLGAKDLEGNPFFEPTQELDFVRNLQQGRFSALLLPTEISGVQRWQIFAHNSKTGLIDSFNIERAADGLFNTKGTQFYTSPDPEYQGSVFEREPGICPFTGESLIAIVSKEGYGESGLQFDGHDDYVDFGSIDFARGNYTVEGWFKSSAASDQMAILTARKADNTYGITLELLSDGKLRYLHRAHNTDHYATSTKVCNDGIWHHFSAVKNDTEQKLYLDGELIFSSPMTDNITEDLTVVIGRLGNRSERHFNGLIDEVRLWNRARSADEIKTDLNHRLVGNEVGLKSYWRFDEGSGDTVYDQTDNANHGNIYGDTIWVNSDVPLGDHPGIRRTSFKFEGRTIESGIASLLYYQQEKSNAGYDQQQKPIKKNARVMLATATSDPELRSYTDSENYIGVVDFALSREGKLAQVPDNIDFGTALRDDNEANLERLQQLEQEVLQLQEQLNQDGKKLPTSSMQENARFGESIAISGRWAIVGAVGQSTPDENKNGAAYIYEYDSQKWTLKQELQVKDQYTLAFGCSVAISGDRAIVGDYEVNKAYIFEYNGLDWTPAPNPLAGDMQGKARFGISVAISGDRAIVGADWESPNIFTQYGAAYIFEYDQQSHSWQEAPHKLLSPNTGSQWFGRSVGISGDRAIVGAFPKNEAYIFEYNPQSQSWQEPPHKLLAPNIQSGANFGMPVAISGDRAIVGAPGEDIEGISDAGAAYIFEYDQQSQSWQEPPHKLLAPNIQSGACFGYPIAISGDRAIVGARYEDIEGISDAGAAYIFEYDGQDWKPTQSLLAPNIQSEANFGFSVAISEDQAIVGASREDIEGITKAGAAYFFSILNPDLLQAELEEKQSEIEEIQERLDGNIALPMHLLHTDSFGLTVTGGLLEFAATNDSPQLFDSALGKLALYFRGSVDEFFVAYYDTNTTKAQYSLPAANGTIKFLARSAVPEMNNTIITTTAINENNCKVTIKNTDLEITETWNQVPLNVVEFASVLNGEASKQVIIGAIATELSGITTSLNLENKLRQVLKQGDILLVGGNKVTVSQTVENGATAIPINSASLDVKATTSVYLLPYDYETLASTNQTPYDLQKGSLLISVIPGDAEGQVQNGTATIESATQSSAWVADSPGKAYAFDGNDNYIALEDNSKLENLDASGDVTLETWVDYNSLQDTPARLIHHHSPNSQYGLALKRADSIRLISALELDGNNDYVELPPASIPSGSQITVSFWAYGGSSLPNNTNSLIEAVDESYQRILNIHLPWSNGKVWFNCGDNAISKDSQASDYKDQWSHWAFTKNAETGEMIIYLNGDLWHSETGKSQLIPPSAEVRLGTNRSNEYYHGNIDEVRIWNRARTETEIRADMYRLLNGNESGLVAYYRFENRSAKDLTSNGHDGTVHGNPGVINSPIVTETYSVVMGVENQFIESEKTLPSKSWQHLAGVFNQSYGLRFNGGYLKCGKETALNISQDLTVEIFLKTGNINQKQGLISKGKLKDGTVQDVPYAIFIDSDRKLVFAFEDKNHNSHECKATTSLSNNSFYKIALVRKRGQETLENKESKEITINGDDPVNVDVVSSVDIKEWDSIQFYIEEAPSGNYRFDGDAGTNDQELEIGRITSGGDESYFQGTFSEVRVWNAALDSDKLYSKLNGQEKGLIAWWRMEENQGNIAYDAKGNNHGNFVRKVDWVKNPDPDGSQFQLYLNGETVNSQKVDSLPWGDQEFTLAAYKEGGNLRGCFSGILEEIRIWKVARTQEQIQDNLFTRLKGEKQDLIANYSFDLDNETELQDHSLLGNHLTVGTGDSKPIDILSTAPISNDIPQVRSALAGVETQFHQTIDSCPGVQEYGDTQYDSESNLTGVMKRCYTYIKNGEWHLYSGYKVGNLITEWIGQAQFNPQIIGFIEGTPPVPSENMTYGTQGTGKRTYEGDGSIVNFTQADEVMYNYSTSKENGFNSSFGISAGLGLEFDLRTLVAPLGFGFSHKIETKVMASSSAHFESSGTWSQEQSMSTGRNVTREMGASLGGNWEAPNSMYNPTLGRRWLSGNSGLALVQSETADIFALRLAHNNALVSLQFQPNPDIPKDWNIIGFPLNPRYTTQGTLDGKIGYNEDGSVCTDENYPQATTYGEYSYFKPQEAYNLKNRINQEMQELQNYYNNFDASPLSANNPMNKLMKSDLIINDSDLFANAFGAKGLTDIFGSLTDAQSKDQTLARKFAKRNIANTYVWTADGGFFSETTDTVDVVQDSVTGSYSFNTDFSTGVSAEGGSVIIFEFGLDSSMGGSLNITKTKSKETTKTFSLDVSVAPSGDMQYYNPESGEPEYNDDGTPKSVTGRVDAYRFMTFYLDSAKENFEDLFSKVVDPIWLEQSFHPNAIAMRQANQAEKKPGCWRIMHRVTFVSRILPEFSDPTANSLESAMKAENIESNYELIKILEPFVKNKTQNYVIFADAVRNTLQTYLPELTPHSEEIIKYAALYFGVEEEI